MQSLNNLNSDPLTLGKSQKLPARVGWFRRLCADIIYVARRDRMWWFLPLIVLLLIMAGLLALATLAGPVAPFLYPLL
jgi:Family of unknown function (DUF5989)